MSAPLTILGGAAIGMAAGSLIVPFTRRSLAASVARASTTGDPGAAPVSVVTATEVVEPPRITTWQWAALAVASGLLPAYVLHKVGWSIIAFPPLLLLVGLVQLAYCDLVQRLLPKALVYALSAAVIVSGIVIAGVMHEWQRLVVASIGGAAFFALFFVINLVNPRWMAFGDVRLSLVVGFGLAWVSWVALIEGLFFANVLAVIVGLSLIAAHKAERRSAVPFGLYLALGTALVLVTWS
ncbi:MAG TPA: A24 family peptidase [Acidimicrobiales bacterium]|jgi:leader peptidase (prepilin peptidase)/N-methyltransferase|nr:A24 family peptidase [Acidimicrobiales bacterium]